MLLQKRVFKMKIAPDKKKHFFVGIAMGAVLQLFFSFLLKDHRVLCVLSAIVFSFVVGYGFELYSKFTGRGHYEVMDAIAALAGAIPGIGIVLLFQLL
jgi:VanZ family protein